MHRWPINKSHRQRAHKSGMICAFGLSALVDAIREDFLSPAYRKGVASNCGTERINAAFVKVAQAALTKILPGEEDRFGK